MTPGAQLFDEAAWREALATRPDWYTVIGPAWDALQQRWETVDEERARAERHQVRTIVADALLHGEVLLAVEGPDRDIERVPITTVVVHHAHSKYALNELEATHLLNIYLPELRREAAASGVAAPVWTGHVRLDTGRQTFVGYHFFVDWDSENPAAEPAITQLLPLAAVGWHAGNWAVNCASIGVCINGNFDRVAPPPAIVRAVGQLIVQLEEGVDAPLQIVGHGKVSLNPTTCPGDTFYGPHGWRRKLVAAVREAKQNSQ